MAGVLHFVAHLDPAFRRATDEALARLPRPLTTTAVRRLLTGPRASGPSITACSCTPC